MPLSVPLSSGLRLKHTQFQKAADLIAEGKLPNEVKERLLDKLEAVKDQKGLDEVWNEAANEIAWWDAERKLEYHLSEGIDREEFKRFLTTKDGGQYLKTDGKKRLSFKDLGLDALVDILDNWHQLMPKFKEWQAKKETQK